MGTYTVTDSQTGRKVTLTGDSPPTEQEMADIFDVVDKKVRMGMAASEDPSGAEAQAIHDKPIASLPEYLMGTKGGRFIQGAADLPIGATQFAANVTGAGDETMNNFVKRREQNIATGREATGDSGFDAMRLGGNAAFAVATGGGAGTPATVGQRIAQGAIQGAAYGAATPNASEDYWPDKIKQMGISALTGGIINGVVIPVIGGGVRMVADKVGKLADMAFPNVQKNAGAALNEAAGPAKAQISDLLTANENPLGQGSVAEVASPAGRAEVSGLMKLAAQTNPSNILKDAVAKDASRVDAIREVGGSLEDLASAVGTRAGNANKAYGEAFAQSVEADPALKQILKNPFAQDYIPTAVKLLKASGVKLPNGELQPENITQFVQFMKIAMDKDLSKTGDLALDNATKSAIGDAKDSLVAWASEKNPLYDAARAGYKADSAPVNQMQVGQHLENKLSPALNDFGADQSQRAGVYAQAFRDAPRTIKNATGNPVMESMDQVFEGNPGGLEKLTNVGKDLARSAQNERMANLGSKAANDITDVGEKIPHAHMLSRPVTLANQALDALSEKSRNLTLQYLEGIRNNPAEAKRIMDLATPAERSAAMKWLSEYMPRALNVTVPITAAKAAGNE